MTNCQRQSRFSASASLGVLALAAASALTAGCGGMTVAQATRTYAATGLAFGSVTPGSDIEQTYYLGSFDPRSQLPPSIYRIRVRGQASALTATRFASSWVPAEVVDSLTGSISNNGGRGDATITTDPNNKASLAGAGRGLVMFGPEGFREAPRGHRLVVLMGANPDAVEQAFASALGTVASVKFGQSGASLDRSAFGLLIELGKEREQLNALKAAR